MLNKTLGYLYLQLPSSLLIQFHLSALLGRELHLEITPRTSEIQFFPLHTTAQYKSIPVQVKLAPSTGSKVSISFYFLCQMKSCFLFDSAFQFLLVFAVLFDSAKRNFLFTFLREKICLSISWSFSTSNSKDCIFCSACFYFSNIKSICTEFSRAQLFYW